MYSLSAPESGAGTEQLEGGGSERLLGCRGQAHQRGLKTRNFHGQEGSEIQRKPHRSPWFLGSTEGSQSRGHAAPGEVQGYLAVTADGLPALLARAGIEGLKARHAVGALLPQDVLLAKERFFAMVAVKALSHRDAGLFNNLSTSRERTGSREHARDAVLLPVVIFSQGMGSPLGEEMKLTLPTVVTFSDTDKKKN